MSLTRSLTRPLTRKISRADLTQGFGGSFSPFALDPYLLFDARDSMVGTLENPTLDLNPALPETLDVITATRAGIATYTDPDGNIATASADTVRVDYVDSVPMILVEPSATNLVDYSEDFTHSSWTKSNATLTDDYGIAPDGANTSTRIQYTGGSAYIADNVSSGTYTASAFVKGVAGEVVKFGIGANVGQGAEFTLNGEWQRIQHTGTGGAIFFSSLGGNTATDFEIWGAQVETGSLTSYIPTSGGDAAARTRAADDLVISGSAFSSFFNTGGDGTFYAEFVPRDVLSEQWYLLAGQSYNRRFMYTNDGNARLNAYDGATTRSYGVDMVANQINRAAFTYTATTQEASIDGAVTSPVAHNGNYSTTSRLHLASPANDKQMNGHIKRVLFWPYSSDRL